ncbi:PRA1 family protein 2-like [Corticium candelabrum]|uniref:PRA1 family protein 2-like n=1 Tax=Corticium candelabrum TaxID=121492 RepID=UPI002E26156B|nr:PRA1 family protein 2-like [Corticium candelabrum]
MSDGKFSLAPLRSFSDFHGDSSCYSWPHSSDSQRLQSRIVKNLLYYQTNYILWSIVLLTFFWIKFPYSVSVGCLAFIGSVIAIGYLGAHAQQGSKQKTRGWAVILAAIGFLFIILYCLGAILVFFLAVGSPCLSVLLHASVRKRNFKNKLANKVETLGFKSTPAGVLLHALGMMDN